MTPPAARACITAHDRAVPRSPGARVGGPEQWPTGLALLRDRKQLLHGIEVGRLAGLPKEVLARAIENQCWVVGANRSGRDPKFTYRGGSLVIGPFGCIHAEAGEGEEALRASIDLSAVARLRESFPVLRDMKADRTCP